MATSSKQKPATSPKQVTLLVGTRKGAFILTSDAKRKTWAVNGPHFLGHIVNHLMLDPRDGKTLVCAARAGHLGPTVFRSTNNGKTWKEASKPPAFRKSDDPNAESVSHVFWLTPGHASEPGVWYAGTSPTGLFVSKDGGDTWTGIDGFNEHKDRRKWIGEGPDAPPDGRTLHSINIDPHDAKHIYIGLSAGGVFESHDGGNTWTTLNKGCDAVFLPEPDADYGHDPHCLRVHPLHPERVVQQNHCGIYVLDYAAKKWDRIGKKMPKRVGDIGFPLVLHPHNPDAFWVFPMDGSDVWPRTALAGKPAVYGTVNAGKTFTRMDRGMPAEQAWWTVKRQAMCADAMPSVGVYFGTTSGEVWASSNEGQKWQCIVRHLPHIYSVESFTK